MDRGDSYPRIITEDDLRAFRIKYPAYDKAGVAEGMFEFGIWILVKGDEKCREIEEIREKR
ncbi:hypothetical protein Metlim_0420 [Methanoplanus limicola DSM 2279]|jgi:hypothetical protein|uniref:Uncharacterized protein n=2 Tax=Methanoplanus limicola TaxID=2315 RepID=H1Z1N3_9EURY|nr:hypothetical protein Metlim_0420 [Methanoplanus limicola DSM 2279]